MTKEIKKFLEVYTDKIHDVFNPDTCSLYLHGSIAMDAFVEASSDIDIVVVTQELVDDQTKNKLLEVHEGLLESYAWAKRLEVSYLNIEAIQSKAIPVNDRLYYNEGILQWAGYGQEWYFEKRIIIDHGILLTGPDVYASVEKVNGDDLLLASRKLLAKDWTDFFEGNKTEDDEYIVYGTLTMCRLLFTLHHKETQTKAFSAGWVKDHIAYGDHDLIDGALAWQKGQTFAYKDQGLKFIQKVVDLEAK